MLCNGVGLRPLNDSTYIAQKAGETVFISLIEQSYIPYHFVIQKAKRKRTILIWLIQFPRISKPGSTSTERLALSGCHTVDS